MNYLDFHSKISNLNSTDWSNLKPIHLKIMNFGIVNPNPHHHHLKYLKYAFYIPLQSLEVIHFINFNFDFQFNEYLYYLYNYLQSDQH